MSKDHLKNIESTRNTEQQISYYDQINELVAGCDLSPLEKVRAFPVFASRQNITSFIERYEVYKLSKSVPGSIVECGVAGGFGTFTFFHLSTIFESYHYVKKIVGFDTFEGFTGITDKDLSSSAAHMKEGGLNYGSHELLEAAGKIHDQNRAIGHIPKLELVKGDISKTFPKYLEENPALVISLLYMDLDLYKPTKDTLELAYDRVPKGGIIAFDELNHGDYPGETLAVLESLGIGNLRLQRFDYSSMMSFAIKE